MKLFFFAVILLFCSHVQASVIKKINVEGNERISKATIENYLQLDLGQSYSKELVDESIKQLFATGFFSDIKISENGGVLLVKVHENPQINKIAFEGNKRIKDEDIIKELNMNERSVFSLNKLQNDTKRIVALYQRKGRYTVKVEPKIIKLDQNRINLIYEIEEGKVAKIKKIEFSGNEQFSASKLSRVILSQEERWYRFFSSTDVYDNEKLELDKELLRQFYMNEGFADFEVTGSSAELSNRKDAFLVTFVLHEGAMYKFGETNIESKIAGIDTDHLKKLLDYKKGNVFNDQEVKNTVDIITDYLGEKGYAFADVDYEIVRNREEKIADIRIIINESYKVYINKINIKNNTRTLDKVIRREFRVSEGDPYNISKISRSKQRIKNLGFFNNVEFQNVKTDSPDKIDVDVDVEEKSTGAINFSVGYNTVAGPLGSISLSESNFLGKGQDVSLSFTKAKRSSDVIFSFTEPYFMDYPLAAGFDIFTTSQNKTHESSFNSKSTGFVLRMGYDLTEHLTHGLRYGLKKERVYDVGQSASIYIKEQAGNNVVSSIGHTLIYDKLDDATDPTKGYLIKFSQDFAGVGGNTKYLDNKISLGTFYPVYKREVVLGFSLRGGRIDGFGGKRVRISDRYFLGTDDVRGFDIGGIGPRDKITGDALGGKIFYNGSLELSFPLGIASEYGLKGHVFTDFGSVFNPDIKAVDKASIYNDKSIRASYGVGIKWTSGIGVIRLDYGLPFRKKSYDQVKRFNINFGAGTKF